MAKPKRTRGDAQTGEHLNSPVTDPGYWPYDRLAGGLQERVTGLDTPADPMGFTPSEGKGARDESDFEGKD